MFFSLKATGLLFVAMAFTGIVALKATADDPKPETGKSASPQIPDYVLKVLAYIDKNNKAMPGYHGGGRFGNAERLLPQKDKAGKNISYREWDVLPLVPGKNRGAERMVTGSDKSAYYTIDHYVSFKKIR